MLRIIKYVLYDILQSRIVLGYLLFLLLVTAGLFNISDNPAKGMISLLNIVLIVTPLVSIVFATIHFYNAGEFIELLAAQPLRRSTILWSEYIGLGAALSIAVIVGLGLPMILFSALSLTGLTLLVVALGDANGRVGRRVGGRVGGGSWVCTLSVVRAFGPGAKPAAPRRPAKQLKARASQSPVACPQCVAVPQRPRR